MNRKRRKLQDRAGMPSTASGYSSSSLFGGEALDGAQYVTPNMPNQIDSKSGLRYLPLNGSSMDSDDTISSPIMSRPNPPQAQVRSAQNNAHTEPIQRSSSTAATPRVFHQEQWKNQEYLHSSTVTPTLPPYDLHEQSKNVKKRVWQKLLELYARMVGATLNESKRLLDSRTICSNINNAGLGINIFLDMKFILKTLQNNPAFTYNKGGWGFRLDFYKSHYPDLLLEISLEQEALGLSTYNEAILCWRILGDNISEKHMFITKALDELDLLERLIRMIVQGKPIHNVKPSLCYHTIPEYTRALDQNDITRETHA